MSVFLPHRRRRRTADLSYRERNPRLIREGLQWLRTPPPTVITAEESRRLAAIPVKPEPLVWRYPRFHVLTNRPPHAPEEVY